MLLTIPMLNSFESDGASFTIESATLDNKPVEIIDDYGTDGKWFVFGFEYGPTALIRARTLGDAYEAFIDEQPTISEDDLYAAYGIIDELKELPAFEWTPQDEQFERTNAISQALLDIWHSYTANRLGNNLDTDEWYAVLSAYSFTIQPHFGSSQKTSYDTILRHDEIEQLASYLASRPEHGWDLIEGYEYQSSASGTGIVSTGHYLWYRDCTDTDDIRLVVSLD